MLSSEAHYVPTISDSISSFTESAEGVADLRVHKQVDLTVDALLAERKFLHGHAGVGRGIIQCIKDLPITTDKYLDPEDALVSSLDELIERDENYLVVLTAKKGCIDGDNRLNESHCDMLHSAYDDVLVALAKMIEVAKDMRGAVISHDLASEPREGVTYTNVFELKRAMLG